MKYLPLLCVLLCGCSTITIDYSELNPSCNINVVDERFDKVILPDVQLEIEIIPSLETGLKYYLCENLLEHNNNIDKVTVTNIAWHMRPGTVLAKSTYGILEGYYIINNNKTNYKLKYEEYNYGFDRHPKNVFKNLYVMLAHDIIGTETALSNDRVN